MVTTVRGGTVHRLQPSRSSEENPKVTRVLAELAKRAKDGGASSVMFLPQKGVKFDAYAFAYHTSLAKELNVLKPTAGPLHGTVVINISGHATGDTTDKVTGWAERQLAKEGIKVGLDVGKFQALRSAADKAARELSSDWQKTLKSVTIELGGKSLTLTRETFEKMQAANATSDDKGLAQLASWGNEALRKHFACTNTYNVRLRMPDGQTSEMRTLPRNDPATMEFATRIPIVIPAGTLGEVVLEAWPTGSAEVAGYVEARRYKIHVGKELFDANKAIEATEQYQGRHPSIRWGSAHEDDDLEKHHVSPSPYPFEDF